LAAFGGSAPTLVDSASAVTAIVTKRAFITVSIANDPA
jgi:hypothetical protein